MKGFLTSILLLLVLLGSAQTDSKKESRLLSWIDLEKERHFFVLPSIYYTPETRWAFGGVAMGFFRFDKSDTLTPISSVSASFAYTMNDQILFQVPFNLYLKKDKYRILGDIDFYRYPYFFNGVGNDFPVGYEEKYTASFPRVQLVAMQRVWKRIYTGPRIYMQNTTFDEFETGRLLESGAVPGTEGGLSNGIGWEVRMDNRDNVYAARTGTYIKTHALFFDQIVGSDFSWNQYTLDIRQYFNLGKNHVIALQSLSEFNYGTTPFNRMAQLGGGQSMRGYRKGTYRDQHMTTGQIEYRTPIWGVFGFAAFLGTGAVASEINDFALVNLRPSYGAGVRVAFNKKERIHIRLDYARGDHYDEFYLTLGEAF